jgi:hypothetical protein
LGICYLHHNAFKRQRKYGPFKNPAKKPISFENRIRLTRLKIPIEKESGNMQSDFFVATFFNLGMNLIYTVVALMVALAALRIFDKKFLKTIDIEQELKNNNMAVAVFASTILIFVALIVTFGFRA